MNEAGVENLEVHLSSRNFNEIMTNLGLHEEDLKGKKVLSVGEGLSDFILTLNEQNISHAKAIDPVYKLVLNSNNTKELEKASMKKNMLYYDSDNLIRMHSIKNKIGKTHFPYSSHDSLPFFPDGEFDLIIFSNVCSVNKQSNLQANIIKDLDEILRILNPKGVINFGAFSLKHSPKIKTALTTLVNKDKNVKVFTSKLKDKDNNASPLLLITKGHKPQLANIKENIDITNTLKAK